MSKGKNLIVLAAVFVLLLGAFIYVKNKPSAGSNTESEAKKIKLEVYDQNKIKKMMIASEKNTLELEKDGDTWKLKPDTSIKLDQTSVGSIATSFANLYADRIVDDNPGDIEQYGLGSGKYTATATLDDGTQKTIYIGNAVPGGSGYYMMVKGDAKLYLIASSEGEHFRYTVSDIRDKTIFAASGDSLNYIKINLSDGTSMEIKKLQDSSAKASDYSDSSWILSRPYSRSYSMDQTAIEGMISSVTDLKASGFVDAKDYSEYGLDKPSLDVTVNAGENALHLLFGKKADDSNIYLKVDGNEQIYKVASSVYDSFNKKPFDIVNKSPYIINIDDVDSITIEENNNKYVLSLSRVKKPAQKEGEEEQVTTTYSVNGKTVKEEDFKNFYQSLIGITIEAENDKKIAYTPDVKIMFKLNKGDKKQVEIDYCPYNSDFYSVFEDGKSDFLISKAQVQKILKELNDLTSK